MLALTLTAGQAAAASGDQEGGSDGASVFAGVVVPGRHGGGGSVPDCNWQLVWKLSLWDRIVDAIRAVASFSSNGGSVSPDRVAELVLDPGAGETNVFLDGYLAELLGRDGSYVVSYDGRDVSLLHKVVVQWVGSHRVGEFQSNPTGSYDYYHHNSSFPEIQRGTYETGSGPAALWWDPYFIAAEDPGPDGDACPPGLYYGPRNSDPRTLIPDLQDFMRDQLEPVEPVLQPLDRVDGWAYVQVPLNFTVTDNTLTPAVATAQVFDPVTASWVWAEAEASPTHLTFVPGDDSPPVRCRVEEATAPFDPEEPGPCSHVYLDSSNVAPGGVYQAAVIVEWKGQFTASSSGAATEFPISPTYAEFDISVGEARAAVSYGD